MIEKRTSWRRSASITLPGQNAESARMVRSPAAPALAQARDELVHEALGSPSGVGRSLPHAAATRPYASPTLRPAYDEAMGRVRKLLPVLSTGRPTVPPQVEWIAS